MPRVCGGDGLPASEKEARLCYGERAEARVLALGAVFLRDLRYPGRGERTSLHTCVLVRRAGIGVGAGWGTPQGWEPFRARVLLPGGRVTHGGETCCFSFEWSVVRREVKGIAVGRF